MSFEFDDRFLRAVSHHYGVERLPTETEMYTWIDNTVDKALAVLASRYDSDQDAPSSKRRTNPK